MSTEKPDDLKQKINGLSLGQYIDERYNDLAGRVDNRDDARLESVYGDNVSWREKWFIGGDHVATIEYREGTGIMVVS